MIVPGTSELLLSHAVHAGHTLDLSSQATSTIRQRRSRITTAVILTPEGVTASRWFLVSSDRSTGNACTCIPDWFYTQHSQL